MCSTYVLCIYMDYLWSKYAWMKEKHNNDENLCDRQTV